MAKNATVERAVNGVDSVYREMTNKASEVVHQTEQSVKDNPVTSSLVTFGVGIGIGLLLTQMLPPVGRRHRWYDDYVPDQRTRSFADAIARKFGG